MSGYIEGFGRRRAVTPPTRSEEVNVVENKAFKDKLVGLLRQEGDFPLLSTNVRNEIKRQFPGALVDLEAFLANNQAFVGVLKSGTSWIELKEKLTDEEMLKWDAFRHKAKDLIEESVGKVASELGFPELKWAALGTPGWRSDIDNIVMTKNPNTRDEVAHAFGKVLFDTLWYATFDGMSGVQVDLETYTSQIGNREIYSKLKTKQAKEHYATIGMMGVHIQIYRCLGKERWNTYKEMMYKKLESELGEGVKERFVRIFEEVESFEKMVNDGISERNTGNDKLAKFAYKTSKILLISEAIDTCEKGIAKLQNELGKIPVQQTAIRESLMQSIEFLEVDIALYGLMRESFMDEGYISAGAFLHICKRGGGQAEARRWEKITREMHVEGIGAQVIQRSSQGSSPEELVESCLENMGMAVQKCVSSGTLKAAKYAERQAEAALKLVHGTKNSGLKVKLQQNKSRADELLVAMRKKEISPENFEGFLEDALDITMVCHENLHEGMETPWEGRGRDAFMQQLKSCLALSDFGRDELEIDDFIKEIFGSLDLNSSWDEMFAVLKETFPLFDVKDAVAKSMKMLKEVKDLAAVLNVQKKDLLISKMASQGFITPLLEKKHLAAFFVGLEPILAAGVGVESPQMKGLKQLHERASDQTLSKHKLEVEDYIDTQMDLATATTVQALKSGYYPLPASGEEELLSKKYRNLLH